MTEWIAMIIAGAALLLGALGFRVVRRADDPPPQHPKRNDSPVTEAVEDEVKSGMESGRPTNDQLADELDEHTSEWRQRFDI